MHTPLEEYQLQHSNALVDQIRDAISNNHGWIDFSDYMQLALYSPGLGYYSAGAQKIGEAGDFITAPQLGNQFAGCIARQCIEVFDNMEAGESNQTGITAGRTIIEFGAGTGKLASDILIYFNQSQNEIDGYVIVETSAELKQRQRQTIQQDCPEMLSKVRWLDCIPESGFSGVVIANELLDALPVSRFEIDESGIARRLGVICQDGFESKVAGTSLPEKYQDRLRPFNLSKGYRSEIGMVAEAWLKTVCESLNQGVIILIDYGYPDNEYYHWDRTQGTLMCHFQHTAHVDPFLYPGLQDITAHVDFSAMAAAAIESGMDLVGYCNQAAFLLSLNILENAQVECSEESTDGIKNNIERSLEIKKLTLPHEMGEIFKVLALSKNYDEPLSGFTMQNHGYRLYGDRL